MLQFQPAQLFGGKGLDIGMDGVAQHEEVRGFKVDIVKVDVGIVHQVLLGFFRMVYVLVPIDEIHLFQRDLVDDDGHRLRGFFLRRVTWESLGEKREIKLVFPFIFNQVGHDVAHFHVINMDFALQQVADVDFCPQFSNLRQIILFQVFNDYIIDKDTQIGRDRQTTYFDVGTSFFRKVTACKTHRKLLNDRVLDGNEKACDDGQHHHKKHQNAMDNLFFNTFDPPN